MQEENSGISLRGIFETIGVQKWIALIVAVVITLAVTLAIQLGYNQTSAKYVTEFTLILPGGYTGNAVYTYPDGTTFHYANMTSYKSLYEIKQSDERFSAINIDKMVEKGGMSVERVVETTKDEETTEVFFRISAASKYFANESVAKEFLSAVAKAPADYLQHMHLDLDVFTALSRQADDYVNQIDLLNSQLDFILDEYKSLIESYGGNFVVDGKTLSSYYNEVLAYNNKNTLNIYLTKVKDEALLKDERSRAIYAMSRASLQRQLTVAEITLENLKSSSQSGSTTVLGEVSVIKTQSDYVENLRLQIKDATKFSEDGVVDGGKFESEYLAPEYETIEKFTDTCESVVTVVYDKTSAVSFQKVNIVSLEGGWSMTKSLLVSLVIGIVVALIVGYIAGYITIKKREKAENKINDNSNAS